MSQAEPVGAYFAAIKGHTLDGREAEFIYNGSIDLSEPEEPEVRVVLSFREGDSTFSMVHRMKIWYEEMSDLMDLSLCLLAIADRDHTVEVIRDIEGGTDYEHGAQMVILQDLHSPCFVELFAKRTRMSMGFRSLWFFFRQEVCGSNLKCFDLLATPEEIRVFARSLHEIYERLWVIQAGTE